MSAPRVSAPRVRPIPGLSKSRVDAFSRWMLRREAANRRCGRPGYLQVDINHNCGTPACTGGYLQTYAPFNRWVYRHPEFFINWDGYFFGANNPKATPARRFRLFGLVFSSAAGHRTALQAVNMLRRLAGLKRLTEGDAA